jgi:hypothetical protein
MHDGIDIRKVTRIGLGIIVALVVVVAAAVGLTRRLDELPAGGVMPPPATWISGPVLETDPQARLGRYLQDKQARLQGYAWIDRQAGIARIPLEQAMRALTEQGAASQGKAP